MFVNRLPDPSDREQLSSMRGLLELRTTVRDPDTNRPFTETIRLGAFVEYDPDGVGMVVGLLTPTGTANGALVLVMPLPLDSDDTARLPQLEDLPEVIPLSAIRCRIDVEEKAPPRIALEGDAGFVLAVGKSLFGMDEEGVHGIGSFRTEIVSVARARRGEMLGSSSEGRLLSIDPAQGRIKELSVFSDA